MKLCEHIKPVYQNEMRHGNRPLFVSTPHSADGRAKAELYIHMKNCLQHYDVDGIQVGTITDYHFPAERYYYCVACEHYLSGPVSDDQRERFEHSQFSVPNEKIVASPNDICVEDGFIGKFIVPVEREEA